jgi:ATP-dependent metalloprotease
LELYLHDKPTADNVDIKAIARGTPGFNGAGEYYLNIFDMT